MLYFEINFFNKNNYFFNIELSSLVIIPEPILASKGMDAIFQEKDKEMLKMGKIFENLG